MTKSPEDPINTSDGKVLSGAASMPPQPVDLRLVMRYFASAVTVVTGAMDTGELFGLTVSAFSSVSLNPPLVLICIRNESTATNLLTKSGRFCVNILAEDQQPIAETFSLSGEGGRFVNLGLLHRQGRKPHHPRRNRVYRLQGRASNSSGGSHDLLRGSNRRGCRGKGPVTLSQ